LIFWGDSKDESTSPYHSLVKHDIPTTKDRLFSKGVIGLFQYKYYFGKMKKEYGSRSPQGLKEIHLYDYIRWDQKVIVDTIQEKLGWSVPVDSPTTWRVDCSLVPIVNHLVEKAYGVSKLELGFSNMIRNGKMAREDALKIVEKIKNNTDVNSLKKFLCENGIPSSDINKVLHSGG
jgi:hypothetical protein